MWDLYFTVVIILSGIFVTCLALYKHYQKHIQPQIEYTKEVKKKYPYSIDTEAKLVHHVRESYWEKRLKRPHLEWLDENCPGGWMIDAYFGPAFDTIRIRFKDEEYVMAFKLRWG